MNRQQLVVLFGDSLLLDSVEASLTHRDMLSVLRLRTATPDVTARVKALRPDLIIFDVDGPNFHGLVPYLQMQPGVPLLGLDINSQQAIGLTVQTHSVIGADELKHVIQEYVDHAPGAAALAPLSDGHNGGHPRLAGS